MNQELQSGEGRAFIELESLSWETFFSRGSSVDVRALDCRRQLT